MTHKIFIENSIIDTDAENAVRMNEIIQRRKAEQRHLKPIIEAREY